MGAVYFYHLTSSPLEIALPQLIERARAAEWKVAVRGNDPAILDQLDAALWQTGEAEFLPHGRAGGPRDDLQPVLLCAEGDTIGNGATCLMSVLGAQVSAKEVETMQRVCIIFDGQDTVAVAKARAQWKSLIAEGCAAQYWAQEDGRWTKKAEG